MRRCNRLNWRVDHAVLETTDPISRFMFITQLHTKLHYFHIMSSTDKWYNPYDNADRVCWRKTRIYIYIYIYIYMCVCVCSTLFLIGSDSLFQRNIDQLTLLVQRFLKISYVLNMKPLLLLLISPQKIRFFLVFHDWRLCCSLLTEMQLMWQTSRNKLYGCSLKYRHWWQHRNERKAIRAEKK